MPRKQNQSKKGKGRNRKHAQTAALHRPLMGVDQKQFALNDIVPIAIRNPITDAAGAANNTGASVFAKTTGQFAAQSLMYTQYYTKAVTADLTLSQGGSTYSMSPLVTLTNPNGESPFAAIGTSLAQLVSAPDNTEICQPYSKHEKHINYEKWLFAMTDRAWRKTITPGLTTRELYPTDGSSNADYVLPSMTTMFEITIPENTFGANSGLFIVGLFKTRVHYVFSQRRTDIQNLITQEKQKLLSEATSGSLMLNPSPQDVMMYKA